MSDTEEIFTLEFNDIVVDYEGTPSAGMADQGTLDYMPFETLLHRVIAPGVQVEILEKEVEFLQQFSQRIPEDKAKEFYRRLLKGRYRLTLERIKD